MKKIVIILTLIMMLAFAGCANNGGDSDTNPPSFYGGSQGVIAEFEQMGLIDGGLETVWVNTDFPIYVTIKNKGEEIIEPNDLSVTIQGVDTELFNIGTPILTNQQRLEKVSELNQQGGEETINFGEAKLEQITGLFYDATFFASIIYKYKTFVNVPDVCFKYNYQDDSVCNLQGNKKVFSSGAPIIVNKVTQEPSGSRRIALTFEVENVGGGSVAPYNDEFNNLYNRLNFELTDGESTGITFDCTSAANPETATFNDKKTKIVCRSSELPEDTLFTRQVTLELSYQYKNLIDRKVRVRNEPN